MPARFASKTVEARILEFGNVNVGFGDEGEGLADSLESLDSLLVALLGYALVPVRCNVQTV